MDFCSLYVDTSAPRVIVIACIITASCSPIIGTIFSIKFGMTRRRSIFGWFHFHRFFFLWMVPTMPPATRWVKPVVVVEALGCIAVIGRLLILCVGATRGIRGYCWYYHHHLIFDQL